MQCLGFLSVRGLFRLLVVSVLLSMSKAEVARAETAPLPHTVRMVFFSFPPFNFSDGDGVPRGHLIDQFQRMIAVAGLAGSMQEFPVGRARAMLIDGRADVMLTNDTASELQGHIFSSAEPIMMIVIEVVSLQSLSSLTIPDMLKGRSVILQERYHYSGIMDILTNPENAVRVSGFARDAVSGLRILLAGRSDLYIQYHNHVDDAIARLNVTQPLYRYPVSRIPVYINVSKRVPYAQALLDTLVDAFTKINASGVGWSR
ncbi:MAG: transporter substrate-binding domain-containing protein [Alphaproteobacteria bacterium]|nr:transporter substrate-binding domain-containing protein [Alphaproteobacteria bacterium]